ncbi:MAG: DUF1385 domain-containing protein, partial [Candidatus Woesearchaeota archaeon]|nr:DUF1385 domain-containing protein [Candidatus Woesearchaeota archaeon]
MPEDSLALGGQALIEGVMIKTKDKISMACRTKKGIITKTQKYKSLTKKSKFLALPIIRGVVLLIEMLSIGYRALIWSAESQDDEKMTGWQSAISMFFAVVLVTGLFVLLPYYVARIFVSPATVWFHIFDGVVRVIIFVAYLCAMSFSSDVVRSFMYHGAEHKTVHCYEAKKKLTVKNVQKFRPEHPRCGTSFLVIVVAVSIIVFSLVRFNEWYYNILVR